MSTRMSFAACAAAAAGSLLLATPALAQHEFLNYECDAVVNGSVVAAGNVYAIGPGFFGDQDQGSLAGVYGPVANNLFFSHATGAAVRFSRTFVQEGCPTTTALSIDGSTVYRFAGDDETMVFEVQSAADHSASIARGPLSFGPGDWVWANTLYRNPRGGWLDAKIPFIVAGGNNASLSVFDFVVSRTDSGPSDGWTFMMWEVYPADLQHNVCEPDLTQPPLGSGYIAVGPNESLIERPTGFPVPRGYYVLHIRYSTYSSLGVESEDCSDPAAERSAVRDTGTITFRLETP